MKNALRVATFNIQHGSDGNYKSPGNSENVAMACEELNADILGLQETEIGVPRSQKADLAAIAAEASGMKHIFGQSRTFNGRGKVGNALLVRGDIFDEDLERWKDDYHTVRLFGKRYKLPIAEPRTLLHANAHINGNEYAVGVTHLGGPNRKAQLGRAAVALLERQGPHILIGDFNLHLHEVQEALEPYELEALEGPFTSESWNPRQQIDHIAVNGLKLVRIFTHRPSVKISDHLVLVADFEFNEQI